MKKTNKNLLLVLGVSVLALMGCSQKGGNSQSNNQTSSFESATTSEPEFTDSEGTDGLVYELNETQDGYILVDNLTVEVDIKVPELYEGLPVREIGEEAFIYDQIDSLSLPKSLTKIHARAFHGLSSYSKIEHIIIPDSVEEIGDEAFQWCPTVYEITLPKNLKTLGKNVFGLNSKLAKFHIDKDAENFLVKGNVLYSKDMKTLYSYPEGLKNVTFDVPNEVEVIAESAFYGNDNLTAISLGTGVTTIEYRGIAALFALTNLNIAKAKNLTYLGDACFSENRALTAMILPNSITHMGEKLFYGCNSLVSVQFNNKFEILPAGFFDSCSKLSNVILPIGLTAIGASAFESCNSLTSLSIPDTVTSIGANTFNGAMNLRTVNIPSGLTEIEEGTFSNCPLVSSLTFPKGLTKIGRRAFSRMESLVTLDLSETQITEIGDSAFLDCSALTTIKFPTTLKSIGETAFQNCYELTEVNLNDGIETIGTFAFYGWNKLTKVFIPKSIIKIESSAFSSKSQERADCHIYFEAASYTATTNYTSVAEENITFSCTRAQYEAL